MVVEHKQIKYIFEFLPAATKLGQGNIFTSVCLSTGGGLPQCMLGCTTPGPDTPWEQTPLGSRHPPGTRPPRTRHPPGSRHPLRADTPGTRTPVADTPAPLPEADSSIRSTSCRYASYWNAFLFRIEFCRFYRIYRICRRLLLVIFIFKITKNSILRNL